MRLIVREFLSLLRERAELDRILPDLLTAMGFRVEKMPFAGEVEHGLDVAATKRVGGKRRLYLFQVKAGDIDPQTWATAPNGVRASLDDIRDVVLADETLHAFEADEAVVVVVHNGVLRENVRLKWRGYKKTYPCAIERWDIDRLADDVTRHLLNEFLLPEPLRHHLRKTLAFIDVPGYDLAHFRMLLDGFLVDLPAKGRASQVRKRLMTLRMMMALCFKYAADADNLSPGLRTAEMCVLRAWDWLLGMGELKKEEVRAFGALFDHYLVVLAAYVERIAPVVGVPDGLAFNAMSEVVELPLRTFQMVADLGHLVLTAREFGSDRQVAEAGALLAQCVRNNLGAASRPLLDIHLNDIYLGLAGLNASGQRALANSWLEELFMRLAVRKQLGRPLPESFNQLDLVVEYAATGERPRTFDDRNSNLIYFLFELCVVFGRDDLYDECRQVFHDLDLQVWNPPANVEQEFFRHEVRGGIPETRIHLPETFEAFSADVGARQAQAPEVPITTLARCSASLVFLAFKHYRTPVFPMFWRNRPSTIEQ